ncbi:MAG: response regulator [Gammaproteobacteria bacterium]|nr:response regulator [Gammaproteobacteria bacterium]
MESMGGYHWNEWANKTEYAATTKKVSEHGYRVLLIEDNLFAQQVSQHHLNKLGCQVDLAINIAGALSLITQKSYDLVLMDISLPDGDGRDVTRAIRDGEQSLNRGTPVIVITAHALNNEERSCFESGIDCIFPKPLTSTMLATIWSTFVEPDESEMWQEGVASTAQVIDIALGVKILGSEDDAKAILNDLLDLSLRPWKAEG